VGNINVQMPIFSIQNGKSTEVNNLFKHTFGYVLTDSTELSPSCEAASCAPTSEFPKNLWKPKVQYHV
jgi:hypothetical protein